MKKFLVGVAVGVALVNQTTSAAVIGVDAVHGFDSSSILASGAAFGAFRGTITDLGHSIVPLTSFTSADLAGLDGLILSMPYAQNGSSSSYSPGEMAAIGSFVQRGVFVSDKSLWRDAGAGSDRPITFGNNLLLLQNATGYIISGGAIFLADNGGGFNVANFNQLVGHFGISYAFLATDADGRTVTGFVPHPVTAGLTSVGVDFQLAITSTSPAMDLTIGSGLDDILAVSTVPEPTSFTLFCAGLLMWVKLRIRK